MLTNPFSGRELFTYWKESITFKINVVDWNDLHRDTQDRWNRLAKIINQRMEDLQS